MCTAVEEGAAILNLGAQRAGGGWLASFRNLGAHTKERTKGSRETLAQSSPEKQGEMSLSVKQGRDGNSRERNYISRLSEEDCNQTKVCSV